MCIRDRLKALALHDNIPILAVHQATREAGKEESAPPGVAQIGYGYSIGQVADHLIALSHASPRNEQRRSYVTRKVRDDVISNRRHNLVWQVDLGLIEEVPMIGYDDEDLPPGY